MKPLVNYWCGNQGSIKFECKVGWVYFFNGFIHLEDSLMSSFIGDNWNVTVFLSCLLSL